MKSDCLAIASSEKKCYPSISACTQTRERYNLDFVWTK